MNLFNLRKSRGLTQQQVADALGINVVTYYGYEKGRSEPSLQMLIRLADFYNVTLDYLCGHQTQSGLFSNLNEQQLKIIENIENFSNEQVEAVVNLKKLNSENFLQAAGYIQYLLSNQEKP